MNEPNLDDLMEAMGLGYLGLTDEQLPRGRFACQCRRCRLTEAALRLQEEKGERDG